MMPSRNSSPRTPRLPHPRRPIDPAHDPFVGNETADDNLVEALQVVLWKVLGPRHGLPAPMVRHGLVTLSGSVRDRAQREHIETAIRAVAGVRHVTNNIVIAAQKPEPASSEPPALEQAQAEPMVSLIRFCGLDEASLSAALRQGIQILDNFLATQDRAPAKRLFVIYRNRQPATVTLEIGAPVDTDIAAAAAGELRAGTTPAEPFVTAPVDAGLPELLAAESGLADAAAEAEWHPLTFFWQSFAAEDFRPWQGHPAGTVHLPVQADISLRH